MKKLLVILLAAASLTLQGQTSKDHWYGFPPERQVSAIAGGLTGAIFYSVARSNMENEPKWKSMLVSTGATAVTSLIIYGMVGDYTMVERRQNFTAGMVSGITVTLVFSLGI